MKTAGRLLRRVGLRVALRVGPPGRDNLRVGLVVLVIGVIAAGTVVAAPGLAVAADPGVLAQKNLNQVIDSIRTWLFGLLVSLATLFLTVGGIRYLLAGGDPGEVARAKDTLKYAAIGYGLAVLAPVLVTVLQGFVGG
jgi:hypothetical protein